LIKTLDFGQFRWIKVWEWFAEFAEGESGAVFVLGYFRVAKYTGVGQTRVTLAETPQ
jgi:hypothetical protein